MVFLRYAGLKPVVVHGGGPQISAMLDRLGIASEFRGGLRVTTPEAMDVVRMVLVGQVGRELVGLINEHGPFAVGLSGEDARLFTAVRRPAVRRRRAGRRRPGRRRRRRSTSTRSPTCIAAGRIPVISTVAPDARRRAAQPQRRHRRRARSPSRWAPASWSCSPTCRACTPTGPTPASLVSQITADELAELLPRLESGMVPKMEACLRAVRGGVPAAHVVDGRVPHSHAAGGLHLEGFGTMVMPRASWTTHEHGWSSGGQPSMMDNYGTPPLALVRGEGAVVWDEAGRSYVDLLGGIAVNALGHAHPAVVAAVSRAGRDARPRLQPVRRRAAGARWPSCCWRSPAGRAGCSSATPAPRRTRPRSSCPGCTGRTAGGRRPRAASTAARWARSR